MILYYFSGFLNIDDIWKKLLKFERKKTETLQSFHELSYNDDWWNDYYENWFDLIFVTWQELKNFKSHFTIIFCLLYKLNNGPSNGKQEG